MNATLRMTAVAGVLALVFARAAAAPYAGKWEGSMDGRKAVTLELKESPSLQGSIVLYVLVKHPDGTTEIKTDDPRPIEDLRWDGRILHFGVRVDDAVVRRFELRPVADGKAELTRMRDGDVPDLTIALSALR